MTMDERSTAADGISAQAEEQHKATQAAARVTTLRVMTANVHKGFTFFNRRYILPELRDAVHTTEADLVFLQEVIGAHKKHARRHPNWQATPQYEYLADTMWPEFAYGRNAVYPDGDHGNALLSRFPILRHENRDISIHGTEERGMLHSVLDVPGQSDIHAICVHLGLWEAHRSRQLDLLRELLESIPPGDPVIVAGDFNDWRKQAGNWLEQQCGMHEAFVSAFGGPARSFPARWPILCLDRIYVRNATTHNPEVLMRRPWSHLSDHAPLVVEVRL
jgi:endonuclease/exonuclease/phosphatase family metal-dependent hydrolase